MPAAEAAPPPPSRRARRRMPWGTLALVGVLAAFAFGVARLFALRFDVGDVYPPYSTLRSDPLGAKAFFASLEAIPGLRTERSLRSLAALGTEPLRPADYDNGEKTFTCFYLGAKAREWPFLLSPDAVDRLETILRRGGRVVITFEPTETPLAGPVAYEGVSRDARRIRHEGPTAEKLAEKKRPPNLTDRWGIDFRRQLKSGYGDRDGSSAPSASPTRTPTPGAVELATVDPSVTVRGGPDAAFADGREAVTWHSVLDFRTDTLLAVADRWHRLYERRGRPVIVSRPFGSAGGELILVGDSYFLSNEGLRNDSSPALLAALVGNGRRVIFDESHLDIREEPGLMTLARRYRLEGALAALALLVALFVWRNVVSLVPRGGGSTDGGVGPDTVAGRSAGSGYLNLLRRSVRPRDLPAVCLAQWEENAAGVAGTAKSSLTARSVERVRAVFAQEAAQPLRRRSPAAAVYRAMCAAARDKR